MFDNNFTGLFKSRRAEKANRPLIRPEMKPVDWLLEAMALLGFMVLLGFAAYHYPKLPETIPTHYNKAGMPDEFSAKASFLMLPAIALFIYFMLGMVSLIPHQFNYTVKITHANALKQYTMAIRLVRYLKAVIIWMLFYICFATVNVVAGSVSGLGLWFLPVVLGGMFLPVIIYLALAYRSR